MSLLYCSTPYSKYPFGIETAYRMACQQVAVLIRAGVPCISPIAATHGVAIHGGIDPLDHSLWMAADAPLMEACDGLIVVRAEGWRESVGMALEIEAFAAAGKPIFYMDPGVVPAELLP